MGRVDGEIVVTDRACVRAPQGLKAPPRSRSG